MPNSSLKHLVKYLADEKPVAYATSEIFPALSLVNRAQAYFSLMFRINSKGVHPAMTLHFRVKVERDMCSSLAISSRSKSGF